MSKKSIFAVVILLIGAGISYFCMSQSSVTNLFKYKKDVAQNMHSDILKLIADAEKTIMGVSPDEAKTELAERETKASKVDMLDVDIHSLSFDILVYIAKSPTSVAGLQPKQAVNEIIRRYLAIDDENLTFKSMIAALKYSQSQENIEKWAKNEDIEEMESFVKQAAEEDDIAAFAYGVRHINADDKEKAKDKIKKFANHVNNIDDPQDRENYDELMEAIDDIN